MSNYSDFAFYYDGLTKNVDYKKRAAYFDSLIKKYCTTGGKYLVDLACGTGSLSEEFFKLGYDVLGIDYSEEMLTEAIEKKYDNCSEIQYICQDMTNFELYGNADAIICALDSINHLSTPEDIRKTIERAYLFTEPGGVFIFDANTVYKHRNILADNAFIFETDKVFCAWQNSLNDDNSVDITLDFFENNGEVYCRSSEFFTEYAYEIGEIKALLKEAGFDIIGVYDDMSFENVKTDSERAVFAARKR